MSLSTVLQEIKKLKPLAEENTDSGPIETLSNRRGRKNNAIERLKQLKQEYNSELQKNVMFIVVAGADRENFKAVASEKFGVLSADPEEFYKDLSGRVPPVLYMNKSGVQNVFDVLGRHLEDKMIEIGLSQYNQLIFRQKYAKEINSTEEFTSLVKEAINDQIGSEIVGIQAIYSLVDTAIDKGYDKITPIMLSTNDEKLALSLTKDLERLTSRVFMVNSGKSSKVLKSLDGAVNLKEANDVTVEQALKTIKENLKK